MMQNIAIIGSGVMGRGIAQSFAVGGYSVTINDIKTAFLEKARQNIEDNLSLMVEAGQLTNDQKKEAASRISYSIDQKDSVSDADLIIEAIPEDINMKWNLYQNLEQIKKPEAVVSSNTSTFPISKLTEKTSFDGRFIITHFFNPAHLVPLVEIVKKDETDPEVADEVINLLKQIGKSPILLKKEINGFIANRLQTALVREAFSLVDKGIASAEDVDKAITDGPGFRWAFVGPIRTAEFGGLDTWKHVIDNIAPELDKSEGAPEIINRLVAEGKLGTKTGEGLFTYSGNEVQEALNQRDRQFVQLGQIKQSAQLEPASEN
ncbi:3-hydroxyacyl-CoA dehydrogenase family protein [Sporolactobacillus sp. CQH2019]|uniref:3-hydroxyacyl-CoA dehydrogenase family protein n=1 Tax=Sporolactobacillus sp. CQH2019 TaxID=3023512 RepID=UPI002368BCB5|nr:3-hydroxyacyl-CoA dehydrogenase family protein [Sporolactobacillus sp. CQH2019]MDD9149085.1 3-hydroxyacyl-CoA dehydrogenase family protein [Sporolactobacillus sp. CQH2019]